MLGIAWKWQAAIHGGLPKPLERRLAALEAGLLRGGAVDGAASARTAIPRLMPGARLIRVWKGERHEVQVDRDRLSLARPELEIAVRHRPRDHRLPPQRPGLLRPARRRCGMTGARTSRKTIRCAIYTRKSTEEGPRAGLQLARCPARGLRRLHPQPEARGLDRPRRTATMTAATPAARWSALPSPGCSPTSRPARSMRWSSTRSTG